MESKLVLTFNMDPLSPTSPVHEKKNPGGLRRQNSAIQDVQSANYSYEPDSAKMEKMPKCLQQLSLAWDRFSSRSVVIRSVPWALFSAALSILSRVVRDTKFSWWSAAIKHPLAVQVFGIMFAFLITNRVIRAIGRWWDGLMMINQMYMKWYDAFSFIMFNVHKEQKLMRIQSVRTDLSEEDLKWVKHRQRQLQDFSHKMIHWFSLMNALALGTLKYGETGCLQNIECKLPTFGWLTESQEKKLGKSWSGVLSKMDVVKATFEGGHEIESCLRYIGSISADEMELLHEVEDKMYLSVQWIMQALVIVDGEKIIDIAPPILNRVYIAMQDGVGAYLSAYRIAAVPYPYPLAQMMKLLMYAFVFLMPIIIETFTKSVMLTPCLSFLIILSYWGLNRVARELENPFGEDANDLPLHDFCATFNDHIEQMSVLQHNEKLDKVFTFSDLSIPGNQKMPSKKPAALSTQPGTNKPNPAPTTEKVVDQSKMTGGSENLKASNDGRDPKAANKSSRPNSAGGGNLVVCNPDQNSHLVRRKWGEPKNIGKEVPQGAHTAAPASNMDDRCAPFSSEVIEWVQVDSHSEYPPGYHQPQYYPQYDGMETGGGHHTQQSSAHRPLDYRGPVEQYNQHYDPGQYNQHYDQQYSPRANANEQPTPPGDIPVSQRIMPGSSVPDGARRRAPFVFANEQSAQQQVAHPAVPQNQWSEVAAGAPHEEAQFLGQASGTALPPHEVGGERDEQWAHLFLQRRMHIQARMEMTRQMGPRQPAPGQRPMQVDPNWQAQQMGHSAIMPEPQPYQAPGRNPGGDELC